MSKLIALVILLAVVALAPPPVVVANEAVGASTHVGDDKVNINTADAKELMKLSGIHHNLAEKIVKYRDEHGLFKKPEESRAHRRELTFRVTFSWPRRIADVG